jgi:cell division septum initiation protein DivIVA
MTSSDSTRSLPTVEYGTGELSPPVSEPHVLYDAAVVDDYLATIRAEMSQLKSQLHDARRMVDEAEQRMVKAQTARTEAEEELARIQVDADRKVVDAERQAGQIVATAERHADDLLTTTRMQAREIIDEAHEAFQVVFAAANKDRHAEAAGASAPQGRGDAPTNGASPPADQAV